MASLHFHKAKKCLEIVFDIQSSHKAVRMIFFSPSRVPTTASASLFKVDTSATVSIDHCCLTPCLPSSFVKPRQSDVKKTI